MGKRIYRPGDKRQRLAMGLILAVSISLCSCQKDNGDVLSRPVARINEEEISFAQFQTAYQAFLNQYDKFLPNDQAKQVELKQLLLDQMINDRLLDMEARKRGISIRDDVLQARIQQELTGESLTDLEGGRYLDKALGEWVRLYKHRMMQEKLMQSEVVGKIHISEGEMRVYYQENQERFDMPEQVRVRHMALEDKVTFDKVSNLLATGRGDFLQLVREFSTTPDRLVDGDLGFVERGVLPQEFDVVIFRMREIGALSSLTKPVQTQIGYHIFKLEARRPPQRMDFNTAAPLIRDILIRQKEEEVYRNWLGNLRHKADIRINEKLLQSGVE